MIIIEPSYSFETPIYGGHGRALIKLIELSARTCYKSECKATDSSASEFVRKICQVKKHASVMEHASATVRFIVDRGVSHELVRHRLAAYSQESTLYCNYSKEQFGNQITVIRPVFWEPNTPAYNLWKMTCESAEHGYFQLLKSGATAQQARSVLPNSLKTEVVMTANLREWRHVLSLRASSAAHPQMQQLMRPLLAAFTEHLPELFDDLKPDVPAPPVEKPKLDKQAEELRLSETSQSL